MNRNHRAALAAQVLALALFLTPAAHAARMVAIGDVHGAYESFVEILQEAGLLGDDLAWSGGDATLLQLGDFTDRGPRVRSVMDLLMRLQQEAPAAGGRVVVLLGNHEALNLVSELRDVSAPAFLEFSDAASAGELEEEYRAEVRAGRLRAKLTGAPRPIYDDAARAAWMRAHPPGALGYRRAILPDGRYGEWLRGLPTAVLIDGILFLHAGLRPDLGAPSLEAINDRVRDEVAWLDACRAAMSAEGYLTVTSTTGDLLRVGFALLDQLAAERLAGQITPESRALLGTLERCVDYEDWHLFSPSGPLWFRGYAEPQPTRPGRDGYGWTEEEGTPKVAAVLAAHGARHVVVGHSTQDDGAIQQRFGGRAFLIDTGMLTEVYGGKPAALEIDGGVFTAIYADRREELWNPARETALPAAEAPAQAAAAAPTPPPPFRWYGPDGEPLPFRGPEELEDFLRTASVVSSETIDAGINRPAKVLLERDGVKAHAVFRTVSVEQRHQQGPEGKFYRLFRDDHTFECAAYELARALGLDRVPPAVPRVLQGREGSLQAWVENAMTEDKRLKEGIEPPDILRWSRGQAELQVFDALINNHDRNTGNELVDRDWNVWWIDHTRAFQTEHEDERIAALKRVTPELWSALRTVERARVRTLLQPFLRPSELDALFSRWDRIILKFRTLTAEHGMENVIISF